MTARGERNSGLRIRSSRPPGHGCPPGPSLVSGLLCHDIEDEKHGQQRPAIPTRIDEKRRILSKA